MRTIWILLKKRIKIPVIKRVTKHKDLKSFQKALYPFSFADIFAIDAWKRKDMIRNKAKEQCRKGYNAFLIVLCFSIRGKHTKFIRYSSFFTFLYQFCILFNNIQICLLFKKQNILEFLNCAKKRKFSLLLLFSLTFPFFKRQNMI